MQFLSCTVLLALTVILTCHAINTVPELKVDKYLGRWFQMYTSLAVKATFEREAVCITADYGLNADNGTVSVLNQERVKVPTGNLKTIHGYANTTSEPGKLMVTLETAPIVAPYWIIALGNETYGSESLYEYSVVTDSLSASLFVLARDVDEFRMKYEKEVWKFLEDNGFTKFYNSPIKTLQDADCQYGPKPSM